MDQIIWQKKLEGNGLNYRIRQMSDEDLIVEVQEKDGSWNADLSDRVCTFVYIESLLEFKQLSKTLLDKSNLKKLSVIELRQLAENLNEELVSRSS
jgi:hypothetical protein